MESPELPETARRDLRVILQEAQRTKQIVQNLLSFARQMPPQRKPVQLNTILRRTVQLRAYDFNSHGVEIIERLDEDLPYVVGDAHQLQQVFLNILNNAYDAVRDTGRMAKIEISTSFQGPVVEVHFKDNGHDDLNAILDGLRDLEHRGIESLDCRRAQFSADEPIARLRMICQSWKVMFHVGRYKPEKNPDHSAN